MKLTHIILQVIIQSIFLAVGPSLFGQPRVHTSWKEREIHGIQQYFQVVLDRAIDIQYNDKIQYCTDTYCQSKTYETPDGEYVRIYNKKNGHDQCRYHEVDRGSRINPDFQRGIKHNICENRIYRHGDQRCDCGTRNAHPLRPGTSSGEKGRCLPAGQITGW
jgi:hypothetical protein